jgi:PBP1b-binding outer membrane lipoprotein LpoB
VVKSLIGDGNSLTADPELMGIRQLRNSQEFNQANIPGRNGLEAPDLRLTGKISQHINRIDATTQRIDYDFDLSIEDFNTGLALWQGTRTISKLGTNRTVTW